jgi:predicted transcriptional regulator
MTALTLNIPDDLLREAEQLAKANNASLNELLLAAIAERVGVERTQRFFRSMAQRADSHAMQHILDRVPDTTPVPGDELPH